jgi:hypothetical protein
MAVLKHIAIKNADYRAAFNYLVYQHDEYTHKPILDENGKPQLREEYYLDGLLCNPLEFARCCKKTNEQFHKNEKPGEIKSHHYIISFDPKDKEDNGLTGEEAQRMGLEFARQNFPGHQALVCTHTDGHNGSGNIHVHIVINSVRAETVERQDFMERPGDCKAGNKHHLTKDYLTYLKQQVMTMCQNRQLYQVDLLNPALDRVTEQEYWANRRGQEKLDQRNEEIREAGLKPRTTKFETQKEFLRNAIKATAAKSKSLEEFQSLLLSDYGISLRDKRGRFSYTHPDREKAITGRALGSAYERDYIIELILQNQKQKDVEQAPVVETASDFTIPSGSRKSSAPVKTESTEKMVPVFTTTKVRLIIDLETCIKAQQSNAYARKIKIINLQQMAQTLAYVQEHGYASVEELEQELSIRKEKTSVSRKELKATESRLADVNKQIRLTGQYLGNKAIYADYRKTGKSKKFYEEHRAELALYESARDALRKLSDGQKLPSLKALKSERDDLVLAKNGQYESYQTARMEEKELQTICSNVHQMLDLNQTQTLEKERGTEIS